MLEMILDKHVIWVIIGLGAAAGMFELCTHQTHKRMIAFPHTSGATHQSFQREGGKC